VLNAGPVLYDAGGQLRFLLWYKGISVVPWIVTCLRESGICYAGRRGGDRVLA
jgi:hypothetical protein